MTGHETRNNPPHPVESSVSSSAFDVSADNVGEGPTGGLDTKEIRQTSVLTQEIDDRGESKMKDKDNSIPVWDKVLYSRSDETVSATFDTHGQGVRPSRARTQRSWSVFGGGRRSSQGVDQHCHNHSVGCARGCARKKHSSNVASADAFMMGKVRKSHSCTAQCDTLRVGHEYEKPHSGSLAFPSMYEELLRSFDMEESASMQDASVAADRELAMLMSGGYSDDEDGDAHLPDSLLFRIFANSNRAVPVLNPVSPESTIAQPRSVDNKVTTSTSYLDRSSFVSRSQDQNSLDKNDTEYTHACSVASHTQISATNSEDMSSTILSNNSITRTNSATSGDILIKSTDSDNDVLTKDERELLSSKPEHKTVQKLQKRFSESCLIDEQRVSGHVLDKAKIFPSTSDDSAATGEKNMASLKDFFENRRKIIDEERTSRTAHLEDSTNINANLAASFKDLEKAYLAEDGNNETSCSKEHERTSEKQESSSSYLDKLKSKATLRGKRNPSAKEIKHAITQALRKGLFNAEQNSRRQPLRRVPVYDKDGDDDDWSETEYSVGKDDQWNKTSAPLGFFRVSNTKRMSQYRRCTHIDMAKARQRLNNFQESNCKIQQYENKLPHEPGDSLCRELNLSSKHRTEGQHDKTMNLPTPPNSPSRCKMGITFQTPIAVYISTDCNTNMTVSESVEALGDTAEKALAEPKSEIQKPEPYCEPDAIQSTGAEISMSSTMVVQGGGGDKLDLSVKDPAARELEEQLLPKPLLEEDCFLEEDEDNPPIPTLTSHPSILLKPQEYLGFYSFLKSKKPEKKEVRKPRTKIFKLQKLMTDGIGSIGSTSPPPGIGESDDSKPIFPRGREVPPGWEPGQHASHPITQISAEYEMASQRPSKSKKSWKKIRANKKSRRPVAAPPVRLATSDSELRPTEIKVEKKKHISRHKKHTRRHKSEHAAAKADRSSSDENIIHSEFDRKRKFYERQQQKQQRSRTTHHTSGHHTRNEKRNSSVPKKVTEQVSFLKTIDDICNAVEDEYEEFVEFDAEDSWIEDEKETETRNAHCLANYYNKHFKADIRRAEMLSRNTHGVRIVKTNHHIPSTISLERLRTIRPSTPREVYGRENHSNPNLPMTSAKWPDSTVDHAVNNRKVMRRVTQNTEIPNQISVGSDYRLAWEQLRASFIEKNARYSQANGATETRTSVTVKRPEEGKRSSNKHDKVLKNKGQGSKSVGQQKEKSASIRFSSMSRLPPPSNRSEEDTWCYSVNAMLLKAKQAVEDGHKGNHRFPRHNSAKVVAPVIEQKAAPSFLKTLLTQDAEEVRRNKQKDVTHLKDNGVKQQRDRIRNAVSKATHNSKKGFPHHVFAGSSNNSNKSSVNYETPSTPSPRRQGRDSLFRHRLSQLPTSSVKKVNENGNESIQRPLDLNDPANRKSLLEKHPEVNNSSNRQTKPPSVGHNLVFEQTLQYFDYPFISNNSIVPLFENSNNNAFSSSGEERNVLPQTIKVDTLLLCNTLADFNQNSNQDNHDYTHKTYHKMPNIPTTKSLEAQLSSDDFKQIDPQTLLESLVSFENKAKFVKKKLYVKDNCISDVNLRLSHSKATEAFTQFLSSQQAKYKHENIENAIIDGKENDALGKVSIHGRTLNQSKLHYLTIRSPETLVSSNTTPLTSKLMDLKGTLSSVKAPDDDVISMCHKANNTPTTIDAGDHLPTTIVRDQLSRMPRRTAHPSEISHNRRGSVGTKYKHNTSRKRITFRSYDRPLRLNQEKDSNDLAVVGSGTVDDVDNHSYIGRVSSVVSILSHNSFPSNQKRIERWWATNNACSHKQQMHETERWMNSQKCIVDQSLSECLNIQRPQQCADNDTTNDEISSHCRVDHEIERITQLVSRNNNSQGTLRSGEVNNENKKRTKHQSFNTSEITDEESQKPEHQSLNNNKHVYGNISDPDYMNIHNYKPPSFLPTFHRIPLSGSNHGKQKYSAYSSVSSESSVSLPHMDITPSSTERDQTVAKCSETPSNGLSVKINNRRSRHKTAVSFGRCNQDNGDNCDGIDFNHDPEKSVAGVGDNTNIISNPEDPKFTSHPFVDAASPNKENSEWSDDDMAVSSTVVPNTTTKSSIMEGVEPLALSGLGSGDSSPDITPQGRPASYNSDMAGPPPPTPYSCTRESLRNQCLSDLAHMFINRREKLLAALEAVTTSVVYVPVLRLKEWHLSQAAVSVIQINYCRPTSQMNDEDLQGINLTERAHTVFYLQNDMAELVSIFTVDWLQRGVYTLLNDDVVSKLDHIGIPKLATLQAHNIRGQNDPPSNDSYPLFLFGKPSSSHVDALKLVTSARNAAFRNCKLTSLVEHIMGIFPQWKCNIQTYPNSLSYVRSARPDARDLERCVVAKRCSMVNKNGKEDDGSFSTTQNDALRTMLFALEDGSLSKVVERFQNPTSLPAYATTGASDEYPQDTTIGDENESIQASKADHVENPPDKVINDTGILLKMNKANANPQVNKANATPHMNWHVSETGIAFYQPLSHCSNHNTIDQESVLQTPRTSVPIKTLENTDLELTEYVRIEKRRQIRKEVQYRKSWWWKEDEPLTSSMIIRNGQSYCSNAKDISSRFSLPPVQGAVGSESTTLSPQIFSEVRPTTKAVEIKSDILEYANKSTPGWQWPMPVLPPPFPDKLRRPKQPLVPRWRPRKRNNFNNKGKLRPMKRRQNKSSKKYSYHDASSGPDTSSSSDNDEVEDGDTQMKGKKKVDRPKNITEVIDRVIHKNTLKLKNRHIRRIINSIDVEENEQNVSGAGDSGAGNTNKSNKLHSTVPSFRTVQDSDIEGDFDMLPDADEARQLWKHCFPPVKFSNKKKRWRKLKCHKQNPILEQSEASVANDEDRLSLLYDFGSLI